jgi:hypothetical protein
MGWKTGFLTGGIGGAVIGSAGAYMINNKQVEKNGDVKWVTRIPQPLWMLRSGITISSMAIGALAGAMTGAFVQSQFISFSHLAGNHTKCVETQQMYGADFRQHWM